MDNPILQRITKSFVYDSFGMVMPSRSFEAGSVYRYGFNGEESDTETYGDDNIYDYGFRIYNPRLAKFLSVDPLSTKFPWFSPYHFANNNPIRFIDIDGLEGGQPATSPAFTITDEIGTWVSWDGNVWFYNYHEKGSTHGWVYYKDDNIMIYNRTSDVVLQAVIINPSLNLYLGEEIIYGLSKADWKFVKEVVPIIINGVLLVAGEFNGMVGAASDSYDAQTMDLLPVPLESILNDDEMIAYGYFKEALTMYENIIDFNDAVVSANEYILKSDNNPVEIFLLTDEQYNSILNGGLNINNLSNEQRIDPSGLEFELETNPIYTHIIYYRLGNDGSSLPNGTIREYSRNEYIDSTNQ